MRAEDGYLGFNLSATTDPFRLRGGKYLFVVNATFGGGNVELQKLGADNTTWIPLGTASTSNSATVADIPNGVYRVAITTASGVYIGIDRIPGE